MAIDPIHAFYCSDNWQALAQKCKIKSGGLCNGCKNIFDIGELRAHHITELTIENIDDVNITLNESNIEVLCHDCHNAKHARFGNAITSKHVYLVYGSPCSGKNTYVETVATRNDLIIDLDKIHQSLCICGLYDKPNATKRLAFKIKDFLLDEIYYATPRRQWQNAYIIGTYPERYDRDEIVKRFGAELIHISTPKDECVKRACQDIKRLPIREAVLGWIDNYWQRYKE